MNGNLCNMLKCNPSRTEIIYFSSHFSPAELIASIKVGDHYIQPIYLVILKTIQQLLTEIDSLQQLLGSYENSCPLPLDKVTLLKVLKGIENMPVL